MVKKAESQVKKQIEYGENSVFNSIIATDLKALGYVVKRSGAAHQTTFYQSQLADALGVCRETANRITQKQNGIFYTKIDNGFKKPLTYILNPMFKDHAIRMALFAALKGCEYMDISILWVHVTLKNIKGIIYNQNTESGERPSSVGGFYMPQQEYLCNEQLVWPPGSLRFLLKNGGVCNHASEQATCSIIDAWEATFLKKHEREVEDAHFVTSPWSNPDASRGATELSTSCDRESGQGIQEETRSEQSISIFEEGMRKLSTPDWWYELGSDGEIATAL
jgi:hypothetical protein